MSLLSPRCVPHKNQRCRVDSKALPRQGFGLIEGLVAIIIFSLGLVGVMHLMQLSTRSKQNFESYVQGSTLSNQAIERLMALSSMDNPWSIEGFIKESCTGAATPANLSACTMGMKSRTEFTEKLKSNGEINTTTAADGSLQSSLRVTFQHQKSPDASAIASSTTATNLCNDPIFLQVEYTLQKNSAATNSTTTTTKKTYQVPVYQYFTQNPSSLGLPCT